MRRSISTWAVLALVIERPSYGYELGKRFERRFAGVLTLSMAGVYAALNGLERDEHIESMAVLDSGGGRQPKPHYRATPQGAQSYRGWMVASLLDETQPTQVLARLATTVSRDASMMLAVLDEYERLCLRDAASSDLLTAPPPTDDTPQALMDRLILQHRRMASLGVLEWIEYARAQVQEFAQRNGIDVES